MLRYATALSSVILIAACGGAGASGSGVGGGAATESTSERTSASNESAVDTGTGAIAWVRLHDIQGLYGGRAIYLRGDGSALARNVEVGPGGVGMRERRHEGRISAEQLAELVSLLERHGFEAMSGPDRPGIPDESITTMTVRWSDGREHTSAEWDRDPDAAFGALRGWLLGRAIELDAAPPVYDGDFEAAWEPPGFEPRR